MPLVSYVVNTELVQSLSNLNLLSSIKESVGELFTLAQCALNNLEAGYIAQEVANWLVWACSVWMRVRLGLDGCESWVCWEKC